MRSTLLFALVLTTIVAFPFLLYAFPTLFVVALLAWAVCFILDVHVTRLLYSKSSVEFFKMELNDMFKRLVARFGIHGAALVYFYCVEIPTLLLLSLLLFFPVSSVMPAYAVIPCVGTIMFELSFAHISAWLRNRVELEK